MISDFNPPTSLALVSETVSSKDLRPSKYMSNPPAIELAVDTRVAAAITHV